MHQGSDVSLPVKLPRGDSMVTIKHNHGETDIDGHGFFLGTNFSSHLGHCTVSKFNRRISSGGMA